MCRIKYGKAISNNEDVRNLITGIILRQRKEYYKDNIVNVVWGDRDGSSVTRSRNELNVPFAYAGRDGS